jgi:L-ascorbate metabolism protein UlaG (beta-lactamase superfamily)
MVKLILSANAGGVLLLGSHRLLIDALHKGKLPGFSTLDRALQDAVFAHPDFTDPELICVTHQHPDHYSEDLLREALTRWPNAKLCLPEETVLQDDLTLNWLPLRHEGAQHATTPHHGLLITWQGKNILIPGDCSVADEALIKFVDGKTVDLAILNFPWLTLKKGRECLQNTLKPKKCVFWHLPFAGDDCNGYRRSAQIALLQYPGQLLCDPLQVIEIE